MTRRPKETGDEVDQDQGASTAVVEKGIELDEVERAHQARVVDHLHDEMGLAIGRAARNCRADPRRQRRIEEIDVEADVKEAVSCGDAVEDAPQRHRDTPFVDQPHVHDVDAARPQQRAFAAIDRTDAEEMHMIRCEARSDIGSLEHAR